MEYVFCGALELDNHLINEEKMTLKRQIAKCQNCRLETSQIPKSSQAPSCRPGRNNFAIRVVPCDAKTIHSCSWWKSGDEHVMWMWCGTLGTMSIWYRADGTYELGHVACRNANCWHDILLSRLQPQLTDCLLKPGCISIRFEIWLLEMHIIVKYRSKMRVTSVIKAKCWVWTDPLRHHLWW